MADNTELVYRALRRRLGLTPAQAAGAVGGMTGESGPNLDTGATNPSSGAYGMAQWLGGRKTALMQRPNPGSVKTQIEHLIAELKGPESAALNAIRSAKTIEDATKAWVLQFERPGAHETTLGPRTEAARGIFNRLKGVSGGDFSSTLPPSMAGAVGTPGAGAGANPSPLANLMPILERLEASAPQPYKSPFDNVSPFAEQASDAKPSLQLGQYQSTFQPTKLSETIAKIAAIRGEDEASRARTVATDAVAGLSGDVADVKGGGKFKVEGPNPDRVKPYVSSFMRRVAGVLGEPITASDGTGHSKYTVNGNISEHYTGSAVDNPASGDRLTRMGQAALIAAGWPEEKAKATKGGLFNVTTKDGTRYQIIFNTNEGGNHWDHLHVGVRPGRRR